MSAGGESRRFDLWNILQQRHLLKSRAFPLQTNWTFYIPLNWNIWDTPETDQRTRLDPISPKRTVSVLMSIQHISVMNVRHHQHLQHDFMRQQNQSLKTNLFFPLSVCWPEKMLERRRDQTLQHHRSCSFVWRHNCRTLISPAAFTQVITTRWRRASVTDDFSIFPFRRVN